MDAREVLQWFVNNYGLYIGSTRGLFISDWGEEREATLEAAIINLKSRGFSPLAVTGDTLYKQADYLWKESRGNSLFGRPLASKLELELGGSDIVIVDNLEAPENSRHLWYLYSHLLYPRAVSGKPTIITSPLSFQEFVRYGEACQDPDFCGKSLNWEKLVWLIEASMITFDMFKLAREENLPPMLKAEYYLYTAMKDRGMDVVPQHVLGDFLLDFAIMDKERKLNIECDTISALGGSEVQRQEAKRNLVLLSDGWQVLKFSTADIIGGKTSCVEAIDEVWRSGRKRGSSGRLLTGNTVAPMPDLPVDDDVQLSAITYGGGPAAVAGGAGTGKTTCIVQRVAYLIAQGINADSILVLTFNQDTQKSIKRMLEQVVEKQTVQRLSIASWQDLGLKILKENLPAIRRKPPLKIEPNQQKIIQRLLAKIKKDIDPAKLELSVDLDEFYIAAVISMYKAHLISPKQAKDEAGTYGEEIIAKIYQQLEEQLQKANRIDRDDVIALSVQVLLDNAEVRSRYQRQYEFVLIDEYQDATVAQDMLARVIAAPQDNLFFVGDEDETIAEAKNACPELFTEMSLRIPFARCYTLERNWRSHPAIVDHARQLLMGLTRRRINKEFVSAWGQAPASAIVGPAALNDEHEEAQWVANEIQLLVDSGRGYADIAIIYRHHVYATILEEALNAKNIRYQSSNPINNMVPDEVEDILSFLKLVVDPDGPRARESFERVCQLRSKEIDPKLSATIASFAEANNLSYLKAVEIYSEATADQSCRELEQLVRIIRTMHQEKLPPAETIALVRRTQRLNDYYRSVKVPPGVNYEPLKKLGEIEDESRNFKTIADFVKHVTAQKQTGTGVADAGVQVLPILDCKGQEFPVVFMVGMAEGIFPADTTVDLEEERRICYVGFTRAKELLYISYPVLFSGAMLQPSHFLIDARLMAAPLPVHMVPDEQLDQSGALQGMQPQYGQMPPGAFDPASQQYHPQQIDQIAAAQQPQQSMDPATAAYQQQQYAQQVAQQQYAQQQYEQQIAQQQLAQQQLAQQQLAQQQYAQQQYEQAQYQQQQIALANAQYQQHQADLAAAQYQQQQAELANAQYQQQQADLAAAQSQQQAADLAAAQAQIDAAAAEYHRQQQAKLAAEAQAVPHAVGSTEQQQADRAAAEFAQQEAEYAARQKSQTPPQEVAYPLGAKPEEPAYVPHPQSDVAQILAAVAAEAEQVRTVPPAPFVDEPAPIVVAQPQYSDPAQTEQGFQIYTGETPARRAGGMPALPKTKSSGRKKNAEAAEAAASTDPAAEPNVMPSGRRVQPVEQGPGLLADWEDVPAAAMQPYVHPSQLPQPPAAPQLPKSKFANAASGGNDADSAANDSPPSQVPPQAFPQAPRPQFQQAPVPVFPNAAQASPPDLQKPQFPQAPQPQFPGQPGVNAVQPQGQGAPQPQFQQAPQPHFQQAPQPHAWTPAPAQAGHAGPEQHAQAGHPVCPSCHDALEANSRFCGGCGYTLPERVPACPTCGAPLESSAKFCGECGMSLVAPAAGNSAAVAGNMARMHELKDKQQGWTNKLWKMLES